MSNAPVLPHQEDSSRRNNNNNVQDRFASIERAAANTSLQHSSGMSPFEKKIASYQKSAERRKTGERSGSRSRPPNQAPTSSGTNFYAGGHSGAGSLVEPSHPEVEGQELTMIR